MFQEIAEIEIRTYNAMTMEKFEFEWTNLQKYDLSDSSESTALLRSETYTKVSGNQSWKFHFELSLAIRKQSGTITTITLCLGSCPEGEISANLKFVVMKNDRVIAEVGDGSAFSRLIFSSARSYDLPICLDIHDIDDEVKICVMMSTQILMSGGSTEIFLQNLPIPQSNDNTQDLLSFLQNSGDDLHDVVIKVDGKEIKCHRCVLCFRSSYFASMSKSSLDCIEITEFGYETIKAMVDFLYSYKCPKIELVSAMSLLRAAVKFQIPNLKDACEKNLIQNINATNVLEVLLKADILSADNIKKHAVDYICKNLTTFKKAEQYVPLMGRPDLLRDLLLAEAKHLDTKLNP